MLPGANPGRELTLEYVKVGSRYCGSLRLTKSHCRGNKVNEVIVRMRLPRSHYSLVAEDLYRTHCTERPL